MCVVEFYPEYRLTPLQPEGNFASVTPAYDINHVHHLPASGLLMIANEGIQMTSYYIPQLGPAPKSNKVSDSRRIFANNAHKQL